MSEFRFTISRRRVLSLSILVGITLCNTEAALQAAPVTLGFTATVNAPRQGFSGFLPPSWGSSLQEGDVILATFTFDPIDAPSNANMTSLVQSSDFTLHIASRVLSTAKYDIKSLNDAASDESPTPTDSIRLGCAFLGGGTQCLPATIAAGSPIEWAFGAAMSGAASVLDGADVPCDLSVWQSFQFYGMDVTFSDASNNQFYGFSATPHAFVQIVPEPSSYSIVILVTLFIALVMYRVFGRRSFLA